MAFFQKAEGMAVQVSARVGKVSTHHQRGARAVVDTASTGCAPSEPAPVGEKER
jgi:hypothetical protein